MKAKEILESIQSDDVVSSLEEWTQIEDSATAVVVGLLVKLERDKAYIELGYESLYAFCTKKLGYGPSAANARIRAAVAALLYEAIIADLESKALSLTAVRLLAPYLTGGPIGAELLSAARGKSCGDIKALLARRFPKPESHSNPRARGLGDGRVKLQIVVPAETADKLQRARELARATALTDDVGAILSQALDRYIAHVNTTAIVGPKRTLRSTARPDNMSSTLTGLQEHGRTQFGDGAGVPRRASRAANERALDFGHAPPPLERDELFQALVQLGHPVVEAEIRTRLARRPC